MHGKTFLVAVRSGDIDADVKSTNLKRISAAG
jgi:hypothetical protein